MSNFAVRVCLLCTHHCGDSSIAPIEEELFRVVVWCRARPANMKVLPHGVCCEVYRASASHPPAAEHPVQRGGHGEENRVPEQVGDKAIHSFWNYDFG